MAKSKRTAALFEVMSQGKHTERRPMAARRPIGARWWFRRDRRPSDEPAAVYVPATAPMPAAPPPPPPLPPMPVYIELPPPPEAVEDDPTSAVSTVSIFAKVRDALKKPFAFQFTFGTAALSGTTLVLVLMLTFLVGRRMGRPTLPKLSALTTEQIRHLPPQPAVMDVGTRKLSAAVAPAPAAMPSVTGDPSILEDASRKVGLNYVIVQSYPDEKNADDARDLLLSNKIGCTVEVCPVGWGPTTWFSVVGIVGFPRIHNSPQYDQYIQSIEAIGAKFAGNSKFKRFEPHAYKWKDTQ